MALIDTIIKPLLFKRTFISLSLTYQCEGEGLFLEVSVAALCLAVANRPEDGKQEHRHDYYHYHGNCGLLPWLFMIWRGQTQINAQATLGCSLGAHV